MDREQIINKKISRREALFGGAKLVAAGTVFPLIGSHGESLGKDIPQKSNESHLLAPNKEAQKETAQHHDSKINDYTAYAVAGAFGAAIGAVASGKVDFGKETIIPVAAAEAVRMSLLKSNDPEVFDHEANELAISLGLVPVLAVVAETADSTRVYVDSLFESKRLPENEAEFMAIEETHAGKHKLENLTEKSVEQCKRYLIDQKEEIIKIASANAALVTVVSPLATTYVGASAAADSFGPMTRVLAKAYYTKEVIDAKENRSELDHEKLARQAVEKAQSSMNSQAGYCNLSLAMSANTSGMAGIGDPPLIYSGIINHSPYNHALVSAEGLVISELANVSANMAWLKSLKLDLDTKHYSSQFIKYHARTVKTIADSITNGETRQGFMWGYAGQSKEVTRLLQFLGKSGEITDDNVGQLREHLQTISHPVFELDISEYLPRKLRGATAELRKKSKMFGLNLEDSKKAEQEFNFQDAITDLFSETNTHEAYTKARNIDEIKKEQNIKELGATLLSIMQNGEAEETKAKLKELSQDIDPKGPLLLNLRMQKFLTDDSNLSNDEINAIAPLFGVMGAQEVEKSLSHALEHYRGSQREHPRDELLGHASSEVVAALTTQLPAVPSLVHLTDKYLPKIVDSEVGGKLPASKINKKVGAVLFATAAISSTADNVAAYLFGKKVLEDMFKEEYGEDLSYEHKWYANDAALLAAIAGGSLSKVGNGANFLISNVEADTDGEVINVKKRKISLAKSYLNPYSIAQTAAVLSALMAQKVAIDKNLPNLYSIKP